MAIKQTLLTRSDTEILTTTETGIAPSTAVISISFCNVTPPVGGAETTVTMWALPSGITSTADVYMIMNEVTVYSSDTFLWTANEKFLLETDDTLVARASGDNEITACVNYISI